MILQCSYNALIDSNALNVALYFRQCLDVRSRQVSNRTILRYACISLISQSLRRHYTLTGLRDNVLLLCTVNISSQRRDQQSCQDRQDDQNYDQLYQRKAALSAAALLLRRFCCSAIIFSIMILFLQISFFFYFYFCKPRRCSAGLHFFFYAAGRCCAVTPVLTGMS